MLRRRKLGDIMTFTRISILGSTGILLFQLVACSAQTARNGKSGARDERIDTNPAGSDATTKVTTGDGQPADVCDWHIGDAIEADKIKWKNTLERPREFVPKMVNGVAEYAVSAAQKEVQMLPAKCYPTTKVFAYGGNTVAYGETEEKVTWSSPGPTFEMKRNTMAHVTWSNQIKGQHLFPMDPTLHWANPDNIEKPAGPFDSDFKNPAADSPVPIVTHIHGLEVASDSDGAPDTWFTWDPDRHGKPLKIGPYEYPNAQPATTLWYHDHALGVTRLNVYAGLAGMYIIRDDNDKIAPLLPNKAHEMPLVIQDKTFDTNGQLVYTTGGGAHPYWSSSFTGETMVVNGKVMPKMDVERTRYRFRVLNGSNNQDIHLTLPELPVHSGQLPFTIIGSDGGYLPAPVGSNMLMLAPGERTDILIDFSLLAPGTPVVLKNGDKEVVQFIALDTPTVKATCDLHAPTALAPDAPKPTEPPLPQCFEHGLNTLPILTATSTRTVTLNAGADGTYYMNGRMFHDTADETPTLGTTEEWEIVNLTYEDHPMHLHLVQFQIVDRQPLKIDEETYLPVYAQAWNEANNGGQLPLDRPAKNPTLKGYLDEDDSKRQLPIGADTGWKDTVTCPSFTVTRIRVRWTPQDAVKFPFDAAHPPGYVWHCHMLEHEDNDMMRPIAPLPAPLPSP